MAPLQSILFIFAISGAAVTLGYANAASAGSSASSYASSSANAYGSGNGGGYSSGGGGFPAGGYGGGGNYGNGGGYANPGYGGGGYQGFGGQGFGGGPSYNPSFQDPFEFHKYLQSYLNYMQEMLKQASQASANSIPGCAANGVGERFGGVPAGGPANPPPQPSYSSTGGLQGNAGSPQGNGARPQGNPGAPPAQSGSGSGPATAFAAGSIGPGGGYGITKVSPVDGALGDRFGGGVKESSGAFPAPSGGNVGISSFSSSSSSDVNGKKTNQKSSSVSLNDNGKVTTYTSSDP